MPRAKLYECVALALNIEPLELQRDPLAWDRPVFDEGSGFDKALRQAEVAVANRALPAYTADPDLAQAGVPLDCFADWARAVGWRLPPELAALTAAPGTTEPQASPSGKRTNRAVTAENACRQWLLQLSARLPNKAAAFEEAKTAVANVGPLSRKAFERAWGNAAPAEWKHGGRPRRT